jgi:hypothetical protein
MAVALRLVVALSPTATVMPAPPNAAAVPLATTPPVQSAVA